MKSAPNSLALFMLNAAYQLGDGDFSGNQIGGDDYECDCDEVEGLHYEWDHAKRAPERQPSASDKSGA